MCSQLNLVAATGIPLSHWGTGLQVLLKKVPGVALVGKLCTILLIEGDFNFFKKWFFGHETGCTKLGTSQRTNIAKRAAQRRTPS
jgi:hypothetical protein